MRDVLKDAVDGGIISRTPPRTSRTTRPRRRRVRTRSTTPRHTRSASSAATSRSTWREGLRRAKVNKVRWKPYWQFQPERDMALPQSVRTNSTTPS
eukprot:2848673-Heterocapsa_arctica.AAC.1